MNARQDLLDAEHHALRLAAYVQRYGYDTFDFKGFVQTSKEPRERFVVKVVLINPDQDQSS